jgi:hypothetical protein
MSLALPAAEAQRDMHRRPDTTAASLRGRPGCNSGPCDPVSTGNNLVPIAQIAALGRRQSGAGI